MQQPAGISWQDRCLKVATERAFPRFCDEAFSRGPLLRFVVAAPWISLCASEPYPLADVCRQLQKKAKRVEFVLRRPDREPSNLPVIELLKRFDFKVVFAEFHAKVYLCRSEDFGL